MMGAAGEAERLAFLQQTPPWARAEPAVLRLLARGSLFVRVAALAPVFLQGDVPRDVYVVRSGAIVLALQSVDGRLLALDELRPGACFGELGVLTGRVRSACAQARVDSELLAIEARAFAAAIKADAALMHGLLVLTAERLHDTAEREVALAFMDADARVARLLLHLDRLYEQVGYITISQAELGQWTGLSRQTVAGILGRWRRRGWLTTGRGRIVLFDYQRLAAVSQRF